ncbi:MAG: thiamine phosphate synthase [Gammaproteobacteria bacterium]|nr:thiamine phosphate synthase [Gammaproteobacteria bacterium]MDP2141878.1 thiamine phosphate synthase [Gammaproteobacteria bacterium]MDP2348171.1 thiamine phosphate synthase [Gammaproteobacteria bacterium]
MTAGSVCKRGVYAITDETQLPGSLLEERVTEALIGGISLLQYRNKKGNSAQRLLECQLLKSLCNQYDTPLLINDDVDLCIAVGADGVHLGQSDSGLEKARLRLGDKAIIGITCHSDLVLAQKAEKQGASYVAFGRFYPSSTKPLAAPASLEILHRARQTLALPIVAIGGINAENGAALLDAGADLLAVIHYLFAFPDVAVRIRQLNTLFVPSTT